ncbi:MAG: sulfatase-like hydrolase/transferase [Sandaracinaceae bacterium]|nr:sulfatase-like hydrolase/transferase [Sandaracinaceae bacterium]
MRVHGIVAAIPLSGAAIALLELTRLPAAALAPDRLLAALAQLARATFTTFAVPALLVVATALVLSERTRPRLRDGALAALGIAQVACAREVLIEYPAFASSLPVTAALALLGAAAAAGHVGLAHPSRAGRGIGVALVLTSLIVARAHYALYVGLYPTLHLATLQLCFVGCVLGAGLALGAREPERAPGLRVTAGAAAALVALALVELPASAWARPMVTAYTELGRAAGVAAALARDGEHLVPTAPPPARTSALFAPDEDAEARFAAASGLPPLDVALADYDVLLVLADATRFDRTSLADDAPPTTPRLRALVQAGAHVHTRARAPSNGTFPSLSAMLSMRPLMFTDVDLEPRFWRGTLRAERPSAPEVLRDAGRETFWVGHDHERCFSEHGRGLERGFDRRVLVEERRDAPPRDVDAEIADEAVRALRAARGRFFGLVFFVGPHDPYHGGYDAELARFDRALGRVLDAVDLSRTIVIVTSDHGEAFGEHGHSHHLTSVFAEQVHVPLVTWIGGRRGARHDAPTSTAYLFPWLLLAGGEREQAAARAVLREDVGPMLRALDGAVVSEMIGPDRQEVALAWHDTTVVYDVLAELPRLFDPRVDPGELRDLREEDEARVERVLPLLARYRSLRFEGRRFRFVMEGSP